MEIIVIYRNGPLYYSEVLLLHILKGFCFLFSSLLAVFEHQHSVGNLCLLAIALY